MDLNQGFKIKLLAMRPARQRTVALDANADCDAYGEQLRDAIDTDGKDVAIRTWLQTEWNSLKKN